MTEDSVTRIARVLSAFPNMRFTQLLVNAGIIPTRNAMTYGNGTDPYYLEDELVLAKLEKYAREFGVPSSARISIAKIAINPSSSAIKIR